MRIVNTEETGARIRTKMRGCGVTPTNLADSCCVSSQTVYKWFNGACLPTIQNLLIISDLCSCTIDELIVTNEEEWYGRV